MKLYFWQPGNHSVCFRPVALRPVFSNSLPLSNIRFLFLFIILYNAIKGKDDTMLTKVILENYKVYKNKTVFDLKNSNIGMIFGPESEGKSTLLNSIRLLLELSVKGRKIKDGINLSLLSDSNEFSLEYYFLINGDVIHYKVRFSPTSGNTYERLSVENMVVFERDNEKIKIMQLSDDMDIDNKADSPFIHKVVSQMNLGGNETLKAWSEFLKNSIYINPLTGTIITYGEYKTHSNKHIEKYGVEEFNQFFKDKKMGIFISYSHEGKNKKFNIKIGDENSKTIFVTHQKSNTTLPFTEESLNIQTLLNILPSFFHIKKNKGMLLIDNLSSSLHPKVEETLIKHFMKDIKDSNYIFVSNNAYFLLNKVINPDAIYITYYKEGEGSSIKPLSEHKSKVVTPQKPVELKDLPEQKYKN
jgi:energy-coupling factor transporter ATP-binding protein EcfA2